MAALTYLDTHVVAWLYAGMVERLSRRAAALINETDLYISPVVQLELQYLHETGKTNQSSQKVIADLVEKIGLRLCDRPFPDVIASALDQRWTRDPFDRIIVGQAALSGSTLVSKDELIHRHYPHALWL